MSDITVESVSTASRSIGHEEQFDLSRLDNTYAAQYFGFTAKTFCNGVYNAVCEYMHGCLDALETDLIKEQGELMLPVDVHTGIANTKTQISQKIDKAFDKMEFYLERNVFKIPEKAVLSEDLIQIKQPVSVKEFEETESDITDLKEKILALKYANAAMTSELEEIDSLQENLTMMLQDVQDVQEHTAQACGASDLKDSLVHASSKVLKRIQLLKSIPSIP